MGLTRCTLLSIFYILVDLIIYIYVAFSIILYTMHYVNNKQIQNIYPLKYMPLHLHIIRKARTSQQCHI